jgi:hypothetical protein
MIQAKVGSLVEAMMLKFADSNKQKKTPSVALSEVHGCKCARLAHELQHVR